MMPTPIHRILRRPGPVLLPLLLLLPALALAVSPPTPLWLHRQAEPNESAFTILVPDGWRLEGGIFRVDPSQAGGPAQSLEAKVDLTLRLDTQGTVMLHRYPDWYCIDMSQSPAGQMGFFGPGTNYQGMPVAACPAPRAYLQEYLLPTARPGARNLKIENVGRADGLVRAYRARMKAMAIPMEVGFDGCTMTVSYEEKGVRYRERFLTLIENRGQLAGGQWANRETMSVRAPAEEFEQWEPVFQMICGSVQLSPRWIQGEIRGQQQRVNTMRRVELTVQEIDRQILSHQRAANAEIQNDMYLTLTEQEEYVNPYTGEVERGTDQLGPHRWVTEGGDVLFAPEEGFDPNVRPELNRVDWKRTPVRKRGP